MKSTSYDTRDHVEIALEGIDNECFDNVARIGITESAMADLCAAIDGIADGAEDLCHIPIAIYASYQGSEKLVEFFLKSVQKTPDGYKVAYTYNSVIS